MRGNKVNHNFKSIEGGVLVQSGDDKETKDSDLKIVTKIKPTKEQRSDMLFAFKVCKHVKSNAIIYVKNKKLLLGIWQGIYLFEHRLSPQTRTIIHHFLGVS